MRSAVLSAAPSLQRRRAHHALAEATDPVQEPDRRAWHRALAAAGPDEEVAAELEASAERTSRRGGAATASAFLRKAGNLSTEPPARARRYIAAAAGALIAGAVDTADELLTLAERQPDLDAHLGGLVLQNRALVASSRGRLGEAAPLLTTAARAFQPTSRQRAQWLHLHALWAYTYLGRNTPEHPFGEAVRAAGASPRPEQPTAVDLLLDGLLDRLTDSHKAAAPMLQKALAALERTDPWQARPAVLEMAQYAAASWGSTRAEGCRARPRLGCRRHQRSVPDATSTRPVAAHRGPEPDQRGAQHVARARDRGWAAATVGK